MDSAQFADLARRVLCPADFLAPPSIPLELVHEPRSLRIWEVFLGHLLGPGRTREQVELESWALAWQDENADERPMSATTDSTNTSAPQVVPRIIIHWSPAEPSLYVVRQVLVHGWESYEESPGVIASRATQLWQPELIGTIELDQRSRDYDPSSELRCLVELAVVGASRLPITSVESPLPGFALGRVAYLPRPEAFAEDRPLWLTALERIRQPPHTIRAARGLEFALRSCQMCDVPGIADWIVSAAVPGTVTDWLHSLFQQVSLAPHTVLLDNLVALLAELSEPRRWGATAIVDTMGYMLRHLVRHLTAYDLVTFHSFGANYPDALWLDALLKVFVRLAHSRPELFIADAGDPAPAQHAARLRRRALRQAWLVRLRYEGHRVPDRPTSQGERLRVLPGCNTPASDEPLADPAARPRMLFESDPLAPLASGMVVELLSRAMSDLRESRELLELGTGTFVDRPLGLFKEPGEVDLTPFLAYEAISRRRAVERIDLARDQGLISAADAAAASESIRSAALIRIPGIAADRLPGAPRPGVITLEDAQQASDDFVFRRTTRGSLRQWADVLAGFDAAQHAMLRAWSESPEPLLLIRTSGPRDAARGQPLLTLFDVVGHPRTVIRVVPPPPGAPVYRQAYGVEYLASGLRFESTSRSGPFR